MRNQQLRRIIRRRSPSGGPEPSDGPERSRDWATFSTVLTALAAAAGLFLSAIATYWSVQTARDQLDQSREQDEEQKRRQASLVSAWLEDVGTENPTIVVSNRSLDPVSQVRVYFTVVGADPEPWRAVATVDTVPPCNQLRIKQRDAFPDLHGEKTSGMELILLYFLGAIYRDSGGIYWANSNTHGLKGTESQEKPRNESPFSEYRRTAKHGIHESILTMRDWRKHQVKGCGKK